MPINKSTKRFTLFGVLIVCIMLLLTSLSSTTMGTSPGVHVASQKVEKISNPIPVISLGLNLRKYFDNCQVINDLSVKEFKKLENKEAIYFVNASLLLSPTKGLISFLELQLKKGMPIIFVGNISIRSPVMKKIVDIIVASGPGMCSIPLEPDQIYGIIKDVKDSLPGAPTPTYIFGYSDSSGRLGKGIITAYTWAFSHMSSGTIVTPLYSGPINYSKVPRPEVAAPSSSNHNTGGASKSAYPRLISLYGPTEIRKYPPYGIMYVHAQYGYLYDDGNPTNDFFLLKLVHQIVPGSVESNYDSSYSPEWSTIKFWENVNVNYCDKNDVLLDYSPTSLSGVTTVTVTLGRSIDDPLSWSFSVSHSTRDLSVWDLSDFSHNVANWEWIVSTSSQLGLHTIKVEPGALIETLEHGGPNWKTGWLEVYKVQFWNGLRTFFIPQYTKVFEYGYIMLMIWRGFRYEESPSLIFRFFIDLLAAPLLFDPSDFRRSR